MRIPKFCWFLGFVALLAAASALGQPQLTITEFMAANGKTLADEDREYPDWIEIYNPGPDLNLAGWSLTDSSANLTKWVFPSTNLVAGGYLVVFASGKDRAVPGQLLHTSFSLNADGEYLGLVSPEGEVVSEFAPTFPPQHTDVSYGTYLGRQYYFPKPTPRVANTEGVNDFVADTKFSHDRGFYDQPFDLTLSTATEGAAIYYATNGVAPEASTLTSTNVFLYTGPIRLAGTTVVRAAAFKDGLQPSNVDTETYVFTADVIHQAADGRPPAGWPTSWGSNVRDYGMDPDVVNNPRWKDEILDDLKSLPSFSIVMNSRDLFDPSSGIYANAGQDGRAWERKASVELINPDGSRGFQIDCGIRIRGGFSRSTDNPKHAFRLFFREIYGAPKLRFPLFGDAGADSFDCIDLRTFQNYSWSFQGDNRGVFVRDQINRDLQLAMGDQGERGRFYHLYINGLYWGLYNTCERPEASYGETYYGGNKADYDVIKVSPDNGYTSGATDGNMQAWTRLYNACKAGLSSDAAYEKILGNNPDGTRNPDYEVLVDVDNLIDYMLIILYGGNLDAPISNFLGNTSPNNWYGIRNRTGEFGGFRFFVHDAEHTLLDVNQNRIGPWPAGNSSVTASSPQWVWQKMWDNAEFRLHCADLVHKWFFNGGVLTPAAVAARFQKRTAEIASAVVCESARWGDAKRSQPLTKVDWQNEVNRILNSYLPQRSAIVLNQLRSKKLYPSVVAPFFNQHGGPFDAGFHLSLSAPAGTLYYSLDGSDPRLRGGAVSPAAKSYTASIELPESTWVKARALVGTNWSALNEASFILKQSFTNVLVTEVMYHPPDRENVDGDEFEFLELKNVNAFPVDLSGVYFTNGIQYTFPLGMRLDAGQFAVLVRSATNFAARYPGVRIDGVFTGNLANSGETLTLVHATGAPLFSMNYGDTPPWPVTTDGEGFSLVSRDPNRNPDPTEPANWRASAFVGGSPGADDPPLDLPPVLVNEVLTHTDPPQLDAIELFNPSTQPAAVSGWYLTDARNVPQKFKLPAGSTIPAGGYLVFDSSAFDPNPGVDPSFNLSSHGEEVYLFSADAAGKLTGYSDGFGFGAAANGVTFGRYTNSVGEIQYPPQIANTLGGPNSGPRVGPVVINEIRYAPAPGDAEFIELKNLTAEPVALFDPQLPTNTWRLNGIGFAFPEGSAIPAHGLAVVAASDPTAFREQNGVPAGVPVFGPFVGALQDNGELIELQRPDSPDLVTNKTGEVSVLVPFVTVDAVRYNDKAPWPTNAAGLGPSLERVTANAYGNDPVNWRASFGSASPGLENDGNRRPVVVAGPDQQTEAASFPVAISLAGSATDDGLPLSFGGLTYVWSQLSGPGTAVFGDPQKAVTTAYLPGVGEYILRLTASDGELQSVDDVAIAVTRPTALQTLVAAGSDWGYLDDGSDQGTAWREPDFDDSGWKHGPAQLGYGDGDVATVVGYGPNANDKYVTTYFRRHFNVVGAAATTSATLRFVRDDGIVIYLNGREMARDNFTLGDYNYRTYAGTAVGGTDESTFFERPLDPAALREGDNVLAVELHQANASSSDLSFDLEVTANQFPSDQPPAVDAGNDLAVNLPGVASLIGTVSDDALPNPPGFVAVTWSKVSGPGAVSFGEPTAWDTTAAFDAPGEYVLKLTADDGATANSDTVRVTVGGHRQPQIQSVELTGGDNPAVKLQFLTEPGANYQVQARDSLSAGAWTTMQTVAGGAGGLAEVSDPIPPGEATRFYRIVVQ